MDGVVVVFCFSANEHVCFRNGQRLARQRASVRWMRWLCHFVSQSCQMIEYLPTSPEQEWTERQFGTSGACVVDANTHPQPGEESSARDGYYVCLWQGVVADTAVNFDVVATHAQLAPWPALSENSDAH